jgi:hypothetical protein
MKSKIFKDWLIFILLLGAGLFYLILQIVSIFQNGFTLFQTSEDHIVISRSEIMYELRTWSTIILCLTGSIFYFKFRKAGWIISVGILALFVLIALGGMATIFKMGLIDISTYFLGLVTIILLYALITLFTPTTRKQFQLIRNDFLVAGVFTLFLLSFYFLAQ